MEARQYIEQLNAQKDMMAMTTSYLAELQLELEQKNKALTEARESINSSVRFAEIIQSSLLPEVTILRNYFSGADYKIIQQFGIGGDSVFIRENREGVVFGLFDCTGHGIPAAMLSISANLILAELLSYVVPEPAYILDELNLRLFSTFKNEKQSKAHLEGCLFFYNTSERKITYAMANGKALVLRQSGAIDRLLTDKLSVGLNPAAHFTCGTLDIKTGDKIFIYSDGLTDQFGGQNEKKFSRNRLKQVLAENFNLNCANLSRIVEQQHLEWKKDLEQTDDVSFLIIEV